MRLPALILIFVLISQITLFAHPPSDIIITFDLIDSTVRADIFHQVKDPAEHFIGTVELKVNEKKAVKQQDWEQISAEKQSVIYIIPGLKAGDRISVTGDCNKYGELTVERTVEQKLKQPAPATAKPE